MPLNFDEGATSYFARLSLHDLWGPTAQLETNPPLFYTVERYIVASLGNGTWALRLAPALAGILCVPVAAFIARKLGGRAAGLAAAVLVATSATSVVSSQDARAYSMLALAALCAIAAEVCLLQAYRSSERRSTAIGTTPTWTAYIIASVLALYLHNTAVLLVASLNFVALLCWVSALGMQRRFAAHWIGANALVVVAYAFWMPVVVSQSIHALGDFWLPVPTLADLRYAVLNVYAQPYVRLLQPAPDLLFLAVGVAGAVFYRSNRITLSIAIFVVIAVPALTWLVSQWRPIMNGKTLLWLVPVFLLLVALGCTRIRCIAPPLTGLLVVVQLVACYGYFQTRWDEAFPEVAAVLRAQVRPGDAIYIDSPSDEILLGYYGWPREALKVYAPTGPDKWFRDFKGVRMAAADTGHLSQDRIWVLTRSNQLEHRMLAARISGARTESLKYTFGHGLLRNLALRNLELSLFASSSIPGT